MIVELNLPKYDVKLRKLADGRVQIHDILRQKYVALTPEEWVRQHFVNFLIANRGYAQHLMANEVGLMQNGVRRRCDTVVYDSTAQPIAIVEYKAPEINITERVFDQIVRYNMELGVGCLIVSNGLMHYCCKIDAAAGKYLFLRDIPAYAELTATSSE